MIKYRGAIYFFLFLLITNFFFCLAASAALATDFTMITHRSTVINTIRKDKLRQIFLANILTWENGAPITLVTFRPGTEEAESFAKEYCGMTGVQLKKYYLTKVFGGVLGAEPATVDTADEIIEKVVKTPGAIGFIPKGTNLGKAKELRVLE